MSEVERFAAALLVKGSDLQPTVAELQDALEECGLVLATTSPAVRTPEDQVERIWQLLCKKGLMTPDGTWLQCGKKAFIAALASDQSRTCDKELG